MEQSSESQLSFWLCLCHLVKFSDRITACLSQQTKVSQLKAVLYTAKDKNLQPALSVAIVLVYQQQFQWLKKLSYNDTQESYQNPFKPKKLIEPAERGFLWKQWIFFIQLHTSLSFKSLMSSPTDTHTPGDMEG